VDGDSTDNPQVVASVFNECFLSVAEKTLPQDTATAIFHFHVPTGYTSSLSAFDCYL
jgi:hypothetical protein